MALETFQYIDDLNASNPTATDNVSQGDDHIRGIKTTLKNTFPNVTGAITPTQTELNYVDGVTSNIQTQLNSKLASSSYTAADVLTKIKTVDGAGSGLDADTLDGVSSGSFLRSDTADMKTSGYLGFNDNVYATFGTSGDLRIYHDGSNSYIEDTGTGDLTIRAGDDLRLQSSDTEAFITCNQNGSVQVYYNNVQKFETDNYGVTVTGRARGTHYTDNDGSFNLNSGNHIKCTPSGNITLTFTSILDGIAGTITLYNTGGHTISAASTTKVMGADLLTTISTAGTYVLGFISDGTNVRIYNSGAQQ